MPIVKDIVPIGISHQSAILIRDTSTGKGSIATVVDSAIQEYVQLRSEVKLHDTFSTGTGDRILVRLTPTYDPILVVELSHSFKRQYYYEYQNELKVIPKKLIQVN
jgi:hypothetical protein